ncbi:MAG: CHAT domain-containing protein [Myxococcales bacterium]|nr:CHAT domain-containing protein [Myxococcales bacterium]
MVALGAALALGSLLACATPPCEAPVTDDERDFTPALARCAERYASSGALEDLQQWGHVALAGEKPAEVACIAARMMKNEALEAGYTLLCNSALRRSGASIEDAKLAYDHGEQAYNVGKGRAAPEALARAALCTSQAAWKAGRFESAGRYATLAIEHGGEIGSARSRAKEDLLRGARIARADAYRRIGDLRRAIEDLRVALEHATDPCDQVLVLIKQSMALDEEWDGNKDGSPGTPRDRDLKPPGTLLDKAAEANRNDCAQRVRNDDAIALNRASLLALREPQKAMSTLDARFAGKEPKHDELFLRAVIALNLGDEQAARGYLDLAEAAGASDADWRWELQNLRGELAAMKGDFEAAEEAFRSAIASVELLLCSASDHASDHAPFLLASHRAPYEGLIMLHAKRGQWEQALQVVLEMDRMHLLTATGSGPHEGAPTQRGDRPCAASEMVPVDDVLKAWNGREVTILLAPSTTRVRRTRQVVRLELIAGKVTGRLVDPAATRNDTRATADRVLQAAKALHLKPGDKTAARELGELIAPPEVRARSGTLEILAIGALSKLPIAALRDATGQLLSSSRPLARVPSLLPRSRPRSAPTDEISVLYADLGDLLYLPAAKLEAIMVGCLTAPTSPACTSAPKPASVADLDRARGRLLHIAAHIEAPDEWTPPKLKLQAGQDGQDGDVSVAKMKELALAPRLAVLMNCGSRDARDQEGWGSLAMALLESGTAAVIATDHSLSDVFSLRFSIRFYLQPDWEADPARALARVQRDGELAEHQHPPTPTGRGSACCWRRPLRREPAPSRPVSRPSR